MRSGSIILTIVATAAASMASAQAVDPTRPAPPVAPTDNTGQRTDGAVVPGVGSRVTEVIVTAQRRSERLKDVPIAITAVSGDTLQKTGVNTAQDLGQEVPALRLDLSGGYSQPTIRGVGSALAGAGVFAAVATYVDGVYRPSELSNNFEFADIQSIQVLKGPQGTLFGRNATGGAIVVTTEPPSFTPLMRGTLSYGRYNDFRGTLVMSGPINDKLAVSISGLYHRNDGFVHNLADNSNTAGALENYLVTAKALFKPTADLSFLLTLETERSRDLSSTAFSAYQGRTIAQAFPGAQIPTQRGVVSLDYPRNFTVVADGVTLKTTYDFHFATLTSYTGYRSERDVQQIDFDASNLPLLGIRFPPHEQNFSQEFDFASENTRRVSYVFGLYYFNDQSHYASYYASEGPNTFNLFDIGSGTRAYAAFGDVTWQPFDRLHLTVGGRYNSERASEFFTLFPPGPRTNASTTFNGFTPRAVIRYDLNEDTNVYASYNRGFKSGGYSPTSGSTVPFSQESITAFEVGLKTAHRGFHLETSAFHYSYTNLQVANYVNGSAVIKNAASSEVYGGDVSATVKVTDRFQIVAGAAYTHARFQSFPNAAFYVGTGAVGDPITVVNGNASGNPLPRAPELTGNISASYTQPIGDGSLNFYANVYHTSSFDFDASTFFVQRQYTLLNARVSYTPPGGKFSLSVYGNNLTDATYLSQILPFNSAILQQYGIPRTYGVEVGFKF